MRVLKKQWREQVINEPEIVEAIQKGDLKQNEKVDDLVEWALK